MSNVIQNKYNKEIILDFSFLQNVVFKNKSQGLDELIEKLSIENVDNFLCFQNFLSNSYVKKAFICLLDDKIKEYSKKNKDKCAYNGIVRFELDANSQAMIQKDTYIGFFVNIDTTNASLIVCSIFTTRITPKAQDFETLIENTSILIKNPQINDEEILRRNVLNSNNILEIGKLLTTFEEEKEKWLNYLDFCEDLLRLERKKFLPYLDANIYNVIKIDKKDFNKELENFQIKELKSKSWTYLLSSSNNFLENKNINYEFVKIVSLSLLVDDINKINKIKKTKELSLVPFIKNKNFLSINDLLENINNIYNFEIDKIKDSKNILPLSIMLGVEDEEISFYQYWKKSKEIFLGNTNILKAVFNNNPNELNNWKIKIIYFEIEENFNNDLFDNKNNINNLSCGYLSYTGIGEDVLIERSRQVIKKITEGNVKNPYLINYLFNTKLVELSELNCDINIEDEDFKFNLNFEQKEAVKKAINSKDIFILQGPPGTGKTQVISEIIWQLSKLNRKILLSSQNHEAIKNVIDRLPINPNINKIRLTNQINLKSKIANNFSPERLVYNYYKAIAKNIFDDMNNDEKTIQEFNLYKSNLEKLINSYKSFFQNNSQLKEIQKQIKNLNEKIINFNKENLNAIKNKNFLKEELFNIENLIDAIKNKNFNIVVDVSESMEKCYKESIEFDLCTFVSFNLNFNPNDFSNFYLLIKNVVEEVYYKDEIFLEIQKANNNIINYKKNNEIDLILSEESRIEGLKQILSRNQFINELNIIFDNFILDLENLKIKIELEIESSLENKKDNSIDNLIVKKNELIVIKNNLEKNSNIDKNELTNLIKLINNKYNLNLIITDVDLEDNAKNQLKNLEKKLKDSKKRKDKFKNIFTKFINYLNDNYKINDNFNFDLPSENFTGQMFKDSQKYILTILNELVNVHSMTLTSTNLFKFDKEEFTSLLGLEQINLKNIDVDVVIIDEASKATILEIIMPLIYGKALILVGDYRQLPPILKLQENDIEEVNKNFNKNYDYKLIYDLLNDSAFKKLIAAQNNTITTFLKTQYRSHYQIMEIVNKFYENNLNVLPEVSEQKEHNLVINNKSNKNIIDSRSSVYWIDSSNDLKNEINYEQGEEYSTSLFNDLEIDLTKKMLENINEVVKEKKLCKKPDVAVISFYGLHVTKLNKKINVNKFKNINVVINTVDDFQGKEADYVLVNLVRNPKNLSSKSGREFLKKYERINVAFSRARELLIIIGARRAVEDIVVKIPTIENPNVSNSRSVYSEIINKLDFINCLLKPNDILEES